MAVQQAASRFRFVVWLLWLQAPALLPRSDANSLFPSQQAIIAL
jgi:hypothetical protein